MIKSPLSYLRRRPDIRWLMVWITGVSMILGWNALFLNEPDMRILTEAFFQTLMISIASVIVAVAAAWSWTNLSEWAVRRKHRLTGLCLITLYEVLRSAPQIIGLLIGYAMLTLFIQSEIIRQTLPIMAVMAFTLGLVTAYEFIELFRERIGYFKQKDFYPAMRVCGVSEARIINRDILWYNGRVLLLQKCISVFGVVLFLQSSIDYIISVGLTTDISSVNFPDSLGSVLAKMNSKQDILAVGMAFTEPSSIPDLFTDHLLGISAAGLLVWTLICFFQITREFTRYQRL